MFDVTVAGASKPFGANDSLPVGATCGVLAEGVVENQEEGQAWLYAPAYLIPLAISELVVRR